MQQKIRNNIQKLIQQLQKYADRLWYPPLIGILAALDNLIVIIPNDGILISSAMLVPKRWTRLALAVTIGSTVGALILAAIIELQGLPWILSIYPGLDDTAIWKSTDSFMQLYGLLVVFVVAVTPLPQQPAVILAALAQTPLIELGLIIFIGRLIKFLIMAYLGSHAPRILYKLWGVKDELGEVGVKIDKD